MKNDGGAAFPTITEGSECGIKYLNYIPGMTLRQWYKSQLSSGSLVKQCLAEVYENKDDPDAIREVLTNFAQAIGDMADALIAEDEAFAAREGK